MQHVAVPDGTIAALAQGKGQPVLFVHGFPLTHAMWNAQIAAFSGKYRVIAPDLRGFGESPSAGDTLTMERCADDMHGLLHGVFVDNPIVFCGLSMGGYIAWQFFQKYRAQLKALILCDTRATADSPEAAAGRRKLAESVLSDGVQSAIDVMLPRLFSPKTTERFPQLIAEAKAMILRNKPQGVAAGLLGLAERPDCTALLGSIDVPTLVICGQDDQITSANEMRGMAEAIPGSTYVEIPSAGHMSPIENPDAVNRAISQFLASLR
jgi:3-oxoadipate enol-lactonase